MENKFDQNLQFLRYCLNPSEAIPVFVGDLNWESIFQFANKQAIVGICWQGILRISKSNTNQSVAFHGNILTPQQVMRWMCVSEEIKKRNLKVNAYCVKAVNNFKKAGFKTCILKGQGNTLSYLDPTLRTSGDIDIWTIPTSDKLQVAKQSLPWWKRWIMSPRMLTFSYIRTFFPNAEFKCQHIDFPVWRDMPMEVHFYPMYLEYPLSNFTLKKFFKLYKEEQFRNLLALPNGEGCIPVPTPFFNAIYQLTHINVHLLIEGIGLRHLVDYYYVLCHVDKADHDRIRRWINAMHLSKLAAAVMWIEVEVLGLPKEYAYIDFDEKRGRKLLNEIEITGNFGKYDKRMNAGVGESFWHLQIRKIAKHARFVFDYPTEEISEPFFRFAHFIWRQWYELKWKLLIKNSIQSK